MRFRFVEEHRNHFPANRLCSVVGVSTRGLRAFRSRPARRRQRSDMVTLAHIKEQSRLSLGRYGRPRMTEELKEIGLDVGHRRVDRLMRENGIRVERSKKYKVTTDSNHAFNIGPNLLNRDFHADQPNQKWSGDISYVWTREGWLYLAVILDLHSRGWRCTLPHTSYTGCRLAAFCHVAKPSCEQDSRGLMRCTLGALPQLSRERMS